MNDDPQFDELLRATLEEAVSETPRPGIERRIIASLPSRQRSHLRWSNWQLWGSLATASAVALAALSPHLHHRDSLRHSVATIANATPNSASRRATPEVPSIHEDSLHNRKEHSSTSTVRVSTQEKPAFTLAVKSPTFTQQTPPAATTAEVATLETSSANEQNFDPEIKPIQIAAIEIPPIRDADTDSQPILPIRIDPIQIAAIEIPSLTDESRKPNQ
jgi:hypothetical protein